MSIKLTHTFPHTVILFFQPEVIAHLQFAILKTHLEYILVYWLSLRFKLKNITDLEGNKLMGIVLYLFFHEYYSSYLNILRIKIWVSHLVKW